MPPYNLAPARGAPVIIAAISVMVLTRAGTMVVAIVGTAPGSTSVWWAGRAHSTFCRRSRATVMSKGVGGKNEQG